MSGPVRDRFLFRADYEGYAHRDLLEARPGSVRLLRPSESARRTVRAVEILIALAFIFVGGSVLWVVFSTLSLSGLPAWVGAASLFAVFFGGLIAVEMWWENRSLPLLAEQPTRALDVSILGVQSFGTFQELRAATPSGEFLITVDGRRDRLLEALRLAGSAAATA